MSTTGEDTGRRSAPSLPGGASPRPRSRRLVVRRAAWAAFGAFAAGDLVGLLLDEHALTRVFQPLAATCLLGAFAASVRAWRPPTVLAMIGVCLAWVGDTAPPYLPFEPRLTSALSFLLAMIAYAAALAPMWARARDSLRAMLAIPYAGVVIGLVVACRDGAGHLAAPVLLYAIALAVMAFLAAGVNSLTWIGGTLFLLSSSVLAMSWFLPGAWMPHQALWVMASYFAGHAFLLSGILRAAPRLSGRSAREPGGASLVIVEG